MAAQLQQATDSLPCPDVSLYLPFRAEQQQHPAAAKAAAGHNSFYGAGEINALKAVS